MEQNQGGFIEEYQNRCGAQGGNYVQGVPQLHKNHYHGFWLMYVQVGDFRISRGPPYSPTNTHFM